MAESPVRSALREAIAPLSNADFRWLWIGTVASFTAMMMQMVASGYLIYDLTASSFYLGLTGAFSAVPILVCAPFGGVIADRMDKRRLLLAAQASLGVISLVIALLIATNLIQYWHLLLGSFVTGIVFAFNMPARQVLVADIVGADSVMSAVALNTIGMNITRVGGPALAGVLLGIIGVAGIYFVTVACFAIAVVTVILIRHRPAATAAPTASVGTDLIVGIRYLLGSPLVLTLLTMGMIPALFAQAQQVFLPVFAKDVWHVGATGLGILNAVPGIGGVVGAILVGALIAYPHKGMLQVAAGVIMGVTIMAFAYAPGMGTAIVTLIASGATGMAFMTLNNTLLLTVSAPEMRGRVISISMMTFGLSPLGLLPTGVLADAFGAPFAVAVGGALMTVSCLALGLTRKELRSV